MILPPNENAPLDGEAVRALLGWLHAAQPPEALLGEAARVLTGVLDAMVSLDWQEHVGESLDAAVGRPRSGGPSAL